MFLQHGRPYRNKIEIEYATIDPAPSKEPTKQPTMPGVHSKPQCPCKKDAIFGLQHCLKCISKAATTMKPEDREKVIKTLTTNMNRLDKSKEKEKAFIISYEKAIRQIKELPECEAEQKKSSTVSVTPTRLLDSPPVSRTAAIAKPTRLVKHCEKCSRITFPKLEVCLECLESFIASKKPEELPEILDALLEIRFIVEKKASILVESAILQCLERQESKKRVIQPAPMSPDEAGMFLGDVFANIDTLCDENIACLDQELAKAKSDEESELIHQKIIEWKRLKNKKLAQA